MRKIVLIACGLLAFARAGARTTEVTAVVDMTDEGRKREHPDQEHPAFYLPVMSGWIEMGGMIAYGEKPPPDEHVARTVAQALGRQGYLLAHPAFAFNDRNEVTYADKTVVTVPPYPRVGRPIIPNLRADGFPLTADMLKSGNGPYSFKVAAANSRSRNPSPLLQVMRYTDPTHGAVMQAMPTLAISIRWGDMHPDEVSGLGSTASAENQTEPTPTRLGMATMLSMIAGNSFDRLSLWEQDNMRQRTEVDRYFVVVSAYDFQALYLKHKVILLWSAKMTIPSNGNMDLDPLLPVLVSAGEAHFGRELDHPELSTVELGKARVIIGTPEVKEDAGPPQNSSGSR